MKINHKVEPLDFHSVTITTTPGLTDSHVDQAWANILRAVVPTLVQERETNADVKQLITDLCSDRLEALDERLVKALQRCTQSLRISGKALIVECSDRPACVVLCYCEKPIDDCGCDGSADFNYWSRSRLHRLKLNVPVTPALRTLLKEMKKQCERTAFTTTSW